VTGLQTADTEEDKFAVVMRPFCGMAMRKYGSQSVLSDRAEE